MERREQSAIENIEFDIKYRHLYEFKQNSIFDRAACKVTDLEVLLALVKKQEKELQIKDKMLEKIADNVHDPESFIQGCSLFECNKNDCKKCITNWARNEVEKDG